MCTWYDLSYICQPASGIRARLLPFIYFSLPIPRALHHISAVLSTKNFIPYTRFRRFEQHHTLRLRARHFLTISRSHNRRPFTNPCRRRLKLSHAPPRALLGRESRPRRVWSLHCNTSPREHRKCAASTLHTQRLSGSKLFWRRCLRDA